MVICLECERVAVPPRAAVAGQCGHVYHRLCLAVAIDRRDLAGCPECDRPFDDDVLDYFLRLRMLFELETLHRFLSDERLARSLPADFRARLRRGIDRDYEENLDGRPQASVQPDEWRTVPPMSLRECALKFMPHAETKEERRLLTELGRW